MQLKYVNAKQQKDTVPCKNQVTPCNETALLTQTANNGHLFVLPALQSISGGHKDADSDDAGCDTSFK